MTHHIVNGTCYSILKPLSRLDHALRLPVLEARLVVARVASRRAAAAARAAVVVAGHLATPVVRHSRCERGVARSLLLFLFETTV